MKNQWNIILKNAAWWKDVDFKKRPAYRVRNPGGILTHLVLKAFKSYYLVLKPLKLENVWRIFDRPRVFHVYGTANMQIMHVNCKNLPNT